MTREQRLAQVVDRLIHHTADTAILHANRAYAERDQPAVSWILHELFRATGRIYKATDSMGSDLDFLLHHIRGHR